MSLLKESLISNLKNVGLSILLVKKYEIEENTRKWKLLVYKMNSIDQKCNINFMGLLKFGRISLTAYNKGIWNDANMNYETCLIFMCTPETDKS